MIAPMMGDRKKLLNDVTIMIGKRGPQREKDGSYTEMSNSNTDQTDDSSEMKMFARDIIKAVQSGNADRLATVLSAFKACCGGMDSEEESDEESSDNQQMGSMMKGMMK